MSSPTTASFNRWADVEVVRVVDGECELRMVWRPEDMGQYAGFLHAGMIAALLDTACGFAATTTSGLSVLSSQFSMHCLAPAVGEEFVAIGRVVKAGRKQIFTSGELFGVRDGRAEARCYCDDAAGSWRLSTRSGAPRAPRVGRPDGQSSSSPAA